MILVEQEARADPGGAPARARLARGRPGGAVLTRGPLSPSYPPLRTSQQHALARGRSGPGRRRAVRAPVGDASALVAMWNALPGRWASRQSLVSPSGLVPQCHRWRRSSRCLCSLRSSCAPSAEGLHHARSPITTVPHRPASSGRRVASALIACGEIELALLCAAAHGTLPASGKARCARCARRDGLGAPLGSPAPSRRARPTRRVRADRRQ